jgi:peptidoglycan/xylan/chitin deacetylase (PgdA/CDA1 family)
VRWPSRPGVTPWHARRRPAPRRGLCVLAFHRIANRCEKDHDIAWSSFRALLDRIQASGTVIEARLDAGEPLRGAVALTFDDGTANHLRAGEELAGRGMPGVFFVPAGTIGHAGHLNMRQLHELLALGHRVGSHGFSHVPLDSMMSPQAIAHELRDSKQVLEDGLGTGVDYFAPPGGIVRGWRSDELGTHGYRASRSMEWGIYRAPRERWRIPSIPVTEFTLARGWIDHALRACELPLVMRSGWAIKRFMPLAVRSSVRRRLHDPFRAKR